MGRAGGNSRIFGSLKTFRVGWAELPLLTTNDIASPSATTVWQPQLIGLTVIYSQPIRWGWGVAGAVGFQAFSWRIWELPAGMKETEAAVRTEPCSSVIIWLLHFAYCALSHNRGTIKQDDSGWKCHYHPRGTELDVLCIVWAKLLYAHIRKKYIDV